MELPHCRTREFRRRSRLCCLPPRYREGEPLPPYRAYAVYSGDAAGCRRCLPMARRDALIAFAERECRLGHTAAAIMMLPLRGVR